LGVFEKLKSTVATMGAGNACLYASSRLLAALSGDRVRIIKYYFAAQPVKSALGGSTSGSFSLQWIARDSPLFSQVERPQRVIAARFAQGARCPAATVNGTELAGFLWFVIGPYDEDEVRARFIPAPAGEAAWDFDVTVMPRFRMGRLFSYLWLRASDELASQGVTHSVSRISAFNPVSIASHRRLGARIVGAATFVCIGRWQVMRASPGSRWHVSWRVDQRPTLSIGT
jgi:hypothetical protein